MTITVIFDSSSNFTEAIQEDFVVCTVLLIITKDKNTHKSVLGHFFLKLSFFWNTRTNRFDQISPQFIKEPLKSNKDSLWFYIKLNC